VEQSSLLPLLALAPAALAAGAIVALRRHPALREACSLMAALAQTGIAVAMVPSALASATLVARPMALAPGLPLTLRADPLGVFFAVVSSSLWVVTTVYSIGYTRALRERAQTRYFTCFALCLFATAGIALAGDLLTFFCFFEILTVAGYPLVIHRGTPEAARAGRVYLAFTLGAGAALLGAVVWTGQLAGSLEFRAGGLLAGAVASHPALWALFTLFVIGCGVKASLVPLHAWLPVAMVAPTPVSALLHAVAVVKAGVFGLARVTGFVFGPDLLLELGAGEALAILAGATIVLGSLAALAQDNLKRLLAFSTISQLSYVVVGVALGGTMAFTGGLLHIASHAVLKITLFFCAGAISATAHLERVSELDGIGRRMPFTMGAFAAAAFMLAGLPPGFAFASKWRLLMGAAELHAWPIIAALVASGVLNIAYFAPIVLRAFGRAPAGPVHGEAPPALLVPLLLTAAAGLVFGLAPDAFVHLESLAERAAASVGGVR
jgi:multicomponent Na+:H+ antiporter subunit D